MKKIKEILYPGRIKGFRVDFAKENGNALCFLLIAGLIISICSFVYDLRVNGGFPPGTRTLEYVLFFSASIAILVGYKTDFIKNGTAMLYIWVCLLLSWSLLMCAGDEAEYPNYMFLFLMLVLPLLIRDAWGNILIVTIVFSVAFIIVDSMVKRSDYFALDMVHLAICVCITLYLSERMIHERVTFMENTFNASLEADHDPLTGLYNRRGGEHLIRNYVMNGVAGAFMLVDIDNFKHINDDYGHATGDEILKKIALCLREIFRESDVVMRMGGDEFIVYAVGMADLNHVEARLAKTRASLHQIYLDSAQTDYVTASIGCIVNLGSYPDYESLSAAADKLLYLVKEEGKDNYKYSAIEYKR